MGCDIHTFVEYSDFADQNGNPYWSCMGGHYNPGRDYTMFGVLAGVRDDTYQLFEPRGLPEGELSYEVESYTRIYISDAEEPDERSCTLEQAQSWAARGETIINGHDGKPRWVTDPDLHSHSWLDLAELKLALAYYTLGDKAAEIDVAEENRVVVMQAVAALRGGGERYAPGWDAIVAAMEAFEARGCKTRLVFCFDN